MSVKEVLERERFKKAGSETELYSDFLASFLPHPNSGSITRRVNVESVKMSIRNLLLTNKYERLRKPNFGTNIRRHLFDNFSPTIERRIEQDIRSAIDQHEPRVRILEIITTPNEERNQLTIRIDFAVAMVQQPQTIELTLYRVR